MATAVPSVDFYDVGDVSLAHLLARNINPNKPQILYAAENNNYAAELLLERIHRYDTQNRLAQFQPVNTVIGKMGGVISDKQTVADLGLDRMTPYSKVAIQVEEFNNIIISKITLNGLQEGNRGIRGKERFAPL